MARTIPSASVRPGKARRNPHAPEGDLVRDLLRSREVPLRQAVPDGMKGSERHRVRGIAERDERDLTVASVGYEPVADAEHAFLAAQRGADGAVGVRRRDRRRVRPPRDRVRPLRLGFLLRERLPGEPADHIRAIRRRG